MNLEQTFRQLAWHIDEIWPEISEEERAEYKDIMRLLRMSNPAFREMWYEETTNAARARTRIRRAA